VALSSIPPTDTRPFFTPVTSSLSALLRTLDADAWATPAVGSWQVRDVVAHLIDISLRRLSFGRDGHTPPPPPFPIASDRDFARFINQINADWVTASQRLSSRQLVDWYDTAGRELSAYFESQAIDAPGLFGVSWAGEMESAGWFDTGREFTEQWHHQAQIRQAVGAPPMADPEWLRATLLIALRGLPHAYRNQAAREGDALTLDIAGASGGTFTLTRTGDAWQLHAGAPEDEPTARVAVSDDAAWRLLFNGLDAAAARTALAVTGQIELANPLMSARSIVI
jgi:uncharacterized protein (TIGR03083 family)